MQSISYKNPRIPLTKSSRCDYLELKQIYQFDRNITYIEHAVQSAAHFENDQSDTFSVTWCAFEIVASKQIHKIAAGKQWKFTFFLLSLSRTYPFSHYYLHPTEMNCFCYVYFFTALNAVGFGKKRFTSNWIDESAVGNAAPITLSNKNKFYSYSLRLQIDIVFSPLIFCVALRAAQKKRSFENECLSFYLLLRTFMHSKWWKRQ